MVGDSLIGQSVIRSFHRVYFAAESESESELLTGDTSKDNHSPGPVFREVSP